MTRALEELYLTQAQMRDIRGRPTLTIPSDFISEIDLERRDMTEGRSAFSEAAERMDEYAQAPRDPGAEDRVLRERRGLAPGGDMPVLMTGADLLNGTSGRTTIPQGFAVGSTVRHPQYGLGTVIRSSGIGDKRRVTVHFHDDDHEQTFVQSKAPLQPVGTR